MCLNFPSLAKKKNAKQPESNGENKKAGTGKTS
jgi:hypothetical protein